MYVYGFYEIKCRYALLYVCATSRCYVYEISTHTSQRDYVCIYDECMFMFMSLPIKSSLRDYVCMLRKCMHVCEYVCSCYY